MRALSHTKPSCYVASLMLALLLLALHSPAQAYNEEAPALMPRIYGGEVPQHHTPWATLIFTQTSTTGSRNLQGKFCGGTLIHERFVLTAAHCVVDDNNKKLTPIFLNFDAVDRPEDTGGYEYGNKNIYIHPLYGSVNNQYFEHDLAIIELDKAAPSTVKPLSIQPALCKSYDELTAYGWGETESGKQSDSLLSTQLAFIPLEECKNKYWKGISNKSVCAISPNDVTAEFGNDTCRGDSGGPLTAIIDQTETLVGVTSFSVAACGTKPFENYNGELPYPGVYVHAGSYKDWIHCVTEHPQPDNCPLSVTPDGGEGEPGICEEETQRTGNSGGHSNISLLFALLYWGLLRHQRRTTRAQS